MFAALADPTRRAIYQRLSRVEEQPVHVITAQAGVSQPAVSRHIAVLKRAGLVDDRRAGREAFYRVRPGGLAPLIDWIGLYGAFWPGRLAALQDLLDGMDR